MMEIIDHRLVDARQLHSDNYDERPAGCGVSLIVVHGISLPAGHFGTPYIEQLFLNQLDCQEHTDFSGLLSLKVSSHLLIRREGQVIQFVPFNHRAWHAGVSSYHGQEGCNDFSIGIELEGVDHLPYRDSQYKLLAEICITLQQHYQIPETALAGHSDIAPGRKTDPGMSFEWGKLHQNITRIGGRES